MRLIGISGKAGTGKSTLARMLMDQGLVNEWIDLADELKRECSERFGFPLEHAYSAEGKERIILHPDLPMGSMRVREILQWWGGVRREEDPEYWIKKVFEQAEASNTSACVIADVRYQNEAQAILGRDGWLLRLEPYPGWQPGSGAGHISETDLDDWQAWHLVMAPDYGGLHTMAVMVARVIPRWEETNLPTAELTEGYDRTLDETVREM